MTPALDWSKNVWPPGLAWVIKTLNVRTQHYNSEANKKIRGKCNYVILSGLILCTRSYVPFKDPICIVRQARTTAIHFGASFSIMLNLKVPHHCQH
jgi:hypothetical protein